MMTSPSRKLALIIGGSGGIGKQIALDCLRNSWRVIIASNDSVQLDCALEELRKISFDCLAVQCDIAATHSVDQMIDYVLRMEGCPDILINCAGYTTYRTVEESFWSELENLVQVNLLGVIRCIRGILPSMVARRSGTIVNVASIVARFVLTPNGTYCASKHALLAWSEVLKYELAPFDIHIHVICPGRVETGFFHHETFRTRAPRVETRYTLSAQQVSKATLQAIKHNRFMTYTPWTLGVFAWSINAVPWLVKPIYSRLIRSRLNSYYDVKHPSIQGH